MAHHVVVQPLDLYYWNKNWDQFQPAFGPFFKYWNYAIKFNTFPRVATTESDANALVAQVGGTPFASPRGADVVEALLTPEVDVVWVLNGLDWSQSSENTAQIFLEELVAALEKNAGRLTPSYIPKAVMGYSGGCAAVMFLEALGLCRGIHGPLMAQLMTAQVNEAVAQKIDESFKPFKAQSPEPFPVTTNEVTGENDLANSVLAGSGNIQGYVWGGMLEFAEAILAEGLVTLQNGILFIEGIQMGNEGDLSLKLYNILTNGKNSIKAFVLGWWWNQEVARDYKDRCIQIANEHGIAVFAGLQAGHVPPNVPPFENYPLPYGPATVTGNGSTLTFTYDVGTYLTLLQQRRNAIPQLLTAIAKLNVPATPFSIAH